MSILFDTVYHNECTSTHHKLAMDALRHLRGKQADPWLRLYVRYYEDYLEGSKAPDKEFRDFRNHVLHVGDNYWGGAVKAATKWYDRAVESLVKQEYVEAVYCSRRVVALLHRRADAFAHGADRRGRQGASSV